VDEVPEPIPAPDEVQIDVRLTGVNFADVNARRGVYASAGAALPRGFGMDLYGVVRAVGERVDRFTVGQRVAGFSSSPSYADIAVAHQNLVWAVPDGVTEDQAAAFPTVGTTAFHLLASAARVQPGESVLITASAGGVGSVAVQIARLLGAGLVVGAAGSAARAHESVAAGADAAVDYSAGRMVDALRAATGRSAVDVVLDGVGGGVRRNALECVGLFGRLVHFGNASGEPESLPGLREMRERNIGVVGFHLQRLRTERRDHLQRSAETLLGWLEKDEFKVPVAEILPLERAADAHRLLESRQVSGKLLLRAGRE
jgi:NADPH2:quinone reductase